MAEKWMAKAFSKHPGALHRQLGVPEGEKIPAKKLAKAASGKLGPLAEKRVVLARTGAKYGGGHDRNPGGRPASEPRNPPGEGTGMGPFPHLRTALGVPDVLADRPAASPLGSRLMGKGPKLVILVHHGMGRR